MSNQTEVHSEGKDRSLTLDKHILKEIQLGLILRRQNLLLLVFELKGHSKMETVLLRKKRLLLEYLLLELELKWLLLVL